MFATISAIILVLLAFLHSLLGETHVLSPLFAQSWDIQMPQNAAKRLLRFAWHLTSIAWLGCAAGLLGLAWIECMAWTCAASGVLIFVLLRGHLAWPLFLGAAGLLWHQAQSWPGGPWQLSLSAGLACLVAVAASALHVYWGCGGRWALDGAFPTPSHPPVRLPGPLPCFLVALLLLAWAFCVAWPWLGAHTPWTQLALKASLLVLGLRAVGDTRQIGFSKRRRDTLFAQRDDRIYLPLVICMLFGALASLAR